MKKKPATSPLEPEPAIARARNLLRMEFLSIYNPQVGHKRPQARTIRLRAWIPRREEIGTKPVFFLPSYNKAVKRQHSRTTIDTFRSRK